MIRALLNLIIGTNSKRYQIVVINIAIFLALTWFFEWSFPMATAYASFIGVCGWWIKEETTREG